MNGYQSFVLVIGILLIGLAMIRWWGPEMKAIL